MRINTPLLIAAGSVAFVTTLLVCMPARVLGYWLPPTVQTAVLTGSIWNGATNYMEVQGRPVGALRWSVRPLQLLRGRLDLDVIVSAQAGEGHGRLVLDWSNRIEARDMQLRWLLSALPFKAVPPSWNGRLQADVRTALISDGQIQALLGTFDVRDLQRTAPENLPIGSYRLSFDDTTVQGANLVGSLQDLQGPMQVSGELVLAPGRQFTLTGHVAARADAPEAIVDSLRYLGTPDAQGLRPFSMSGAY